MSWLTHGYCPRSGAPHTAPGGRFADPATHLRGTGGWRWSEVLRHSASESDDQHGTGPGPPRHRRPPLFGPTGTKFPAAPAEPFANTVRPPGAAAPVGGPDRGLRPILGCLVVFHWNRLGLSAVTIPAGWEVTSPTGTRSAHRTLMSWCIALMTGPAAPTCLAARSRLRGSEGMVMRRGARLSHDLGGDQGSCSARETVFLHQARLPSLQSTGRVGPHFQK